MKKLYIPLVALDITLLACASQITNRTIDDTLGDFVTGDKPSYVPSAGIWNSVNCSSCVIQPNSSQTFRGTWHETTASALNPNVSFEFAFTGKYPGLNTRLD